MNGSTKSKWKTGLLILFVVTACFVGAFELISLLKRSHEDKGEY